MNTRTAGEVQASRSERPEQEASEEEMLLRALAGHDVRASLAVADRTRRAVRVSVDVQRETRKQKHSHLGIAAAACAALFLLLAPALWAGMDDLFSGEHFGDLATQIALLVLLLFAATIGALIAGWKTRAFPADRHDA